MNSNKMGKEEDALGLKAIYSACRVLYPNQPTPLQITAVKKFWMGGPDPLDFINMYTNSGSPELNSHSHWHYITNGLSDLYGDSRLHKYWISAYLCSMFQGIWTKIIKLPFGNVSKECCMQNEVVVGVNGVSENFKTLKIKQHHCTSADGPSGFGFELTFRVKRECGETNPPTWPAHLLQSLARYVFCSQAQLMIGDHIPWPTPLDKQPQSQTRAKETDSVPNIDEVETTRRSIAMAAAATAASILAANNSKTGGSLSSLTDPSTYASMVEAALAAVNKPTGDGNSKNCSSSSLDEKASRIQHMLLIEDPQLKRISTPYGYVQFLQIVGLCEEELRLVQRWTGSHVAELMSRLPETGGSLLVTDMKRKLSILEIDSNLNEMINTKLRYEGSNLSGVTTSYFAWSPITPNKIRDLLPGELEAQRATSRTLTTSMYEPKDQHQIRTRVMGGNLDGISKPVAMDTDDSSLNKKQIDEEFVDVVGDGLSSQINSFSTSLYESENSSNNKLSRSTSKLFNPRSNSINGLVPPPLTSSRNQDGHTISAPGGYSGWCARIGSSAAPLSSSLSHQNSVKSCSSFSEQCGNSFVNPFGGALSFKAFASQFSPFDKQIELLHNKRGQTPSSTGDSSAPCTPLAHLSLSPTSLESLPIRIIDYLDVHLCKEAGEMLPLAVNDRLRHGRHFTFLNTCYPDHAITLVPFGMSGAFVSESAPYVARGPWLQILLTDDFLEQLAFQFSCLAYPNEIKLPLVFRWPERHLRICIVNNNNTPLSPGSALSNTNTNATTKSATTAASFGTNDPSMENSNIPKLSSMIGSTSGSESLLSAPKMNLSQLLLSLFPPGCVPPPNVMAALVGSSSSFNPDRLRLSTESLAFQKSAIPPVPEPKPEAQPDWLNKLLLQTAASSEKNFNQSNNNNNEKFLALFEMMRNALKATSGAVPTNIGVQDAHTPHEMNVYNMNDLFNFIPSTKNK